MILLIPERGRRKDDHEDDCLGLGTMLLGNGVIMDV